MISKCPICGKWQASIDEDKSFCQMMLKKIFSKIVCIVLGAIIGSAIPFIGTIVGGIAGAFFSKRIEPLIWGEPQYKFICSKCGKRFTDNLSSVMTNQLIYNNISEENVSVIRKRLAEIFVESKFIKIKDMRLYNGLKGLSPNYNNLYKQIMFEFGVHLDESERKKIEQNSSTIIELYENLTKLITEHCKT